MASPLDHIRWNLKDPLSHHRRIVLGFLWVGLFVLTGRLAGAAKEMAIAWRYGVSETVDAYLFVYNLVSLPVSIFFSVLTVVLLPLLAKAKIVNSADLARFRGELLGLTLLIGFILGCLTYFGLPLLMTASWAGLNGALLQQALTMASPLCLLLPVGLVVSLFSSLHMADGYHRNTLLEALPSVVMLAALLMPPNSVPEPLIWGSIIGVALQMAGLVWTLHINGQLNYPVLGFQSNVWKGFGYSFGIMAIGQALMGLIGTVDQFFAAQLGTGAISILGYANRIISLIVSIGAIAISRAILPIFSKMEGEGHYSELLALARHWVKLMFILGTGVIILSWVCAPWIIKLILERGAFTVSNTHEVTDAFRYGLIQIPFYFSSMVLTSLLASQQKYLALSVIGAFNLLIKIFLNIILFPYLKIDGLIASTALMYVFSFSILVVFINEKNQRIFNEIKKHSKLYKSNIRLFKR